MSYENTYYDAYHNFRGDVVVRFYSDAACTKPLSVSSLTVNYSITRDINKTTSYHATTANGTYVVVKSDAALTEPDPNCDPTSFCSHYNINYALQAGNYTIIK